MALIESEKAIQNFANVSKLPAVRQLGLLVGLAASIALGVSIVFWAQGTNLTPLYGDLAGLDASQVINVLEQSNTPYEYDPGSGVISVPSEQIHEIRIRMASQGLPRSAQRGFDILDDEQSIGTSSFMESARYNRALEEELSLSISSIDSIQSARVHLAIPRQSAFLRSKNQPNASVVVSLYPGRNLGDGQVAGIVYLVASSVAELEPEGVTLIDHRGRLLSTRSSSDDLMLSSEQFRFARQIEESYIGRVLDILRPMLGTENVRVQVTADMDFTSVERTEEEYSPQNPSIRSEQTVLEETTQANASGVPGGLSAQPVEAISTTDGSEDLGEPEEKPLRSTKRETRNFELDHKISHIKETPGSINRLSVAVVINYREQFAEDGVTLEQVELTPEEIAKYEALVREAVGFDEARGDSVTLTNSQFVALDAVEGIEQPIWEQAWLLQIGKQSLGFIAILILIFAVLRPTLATLVAISDRSAKSPNRVGNDPSMDGRDEQLSLSGEAQAVGQEFSNPQTYDQQLSRARSMVQDDPTRVAQVLKTWVAADG